MVPAFCPNPRCTFHYSNSELHALWWKPAGSYTTLVVGTVRRFTCLACGRGFSERTFSIDYYTKKTIPHRQLFDRLPSGESLSAMARNLGCSLGTIQNRLERLGRNCLALHESLVKSTPLIEDLVADGFESFDVSQYHPNAINILVGKESQQLYAFTHATLRRKGRMTHAQLKKRTELERVWRAPRGGIESSFALLLSTIEPIWDRARKPRLTLFTDEHQSYPRSVASQLVLRNENKVGSFVHRRVPSKLARTKTNPLFAVNYFDRELRKDIAAYRRESTCHCRNVANGLLRLAVYRTWHNCAKPHRIETRKEQPPCHAAMAGVDIGRIEDGLQAILAERAFPTHVKMGEEARLIWCKANPTPLKKRPDYRQKFAWFLQQAS